MHSRREIQDLLEHSRHLREQTNRLQASAVKLWSDISMERLPRCPVCGSFSAHVLSRNHLDSTSNSVWVLAYRCTAGHTWMPSRATCSRDAIE